MVSVSVCQNELLGRSVYQFIHVDDQLEFSQCLAPLVERSQAVMGLHQQYYNDGSGLRPPLNRSNSFTCRLQAKPSRSTCLLYTSDAADE